MKMFWAWGTFGWRTGRTAAAVAGETVVGGRGGERRRRKWREKVGHSACAERDFHWSHLPSIVSETSQTHAHCRHTRTHDLGHLSDVLFIIYPSPPQHTYTQTLGLSPSLSHSLSLSFSPYRSPSARASPSRSTRIYTRARIPGEG